MASYSLVMVVMLLFMIHVDSRRRSYDHRRRFWLNTIKDTFNIDFRHFDKEEMILFPDIGFQTSENPNIWKVIAHGWRYEGSKQRDWFGFGISNWFERIAKYFISESDMLYLNGSIDQNRLKPFFVDDESNELITVRIGDKTHSFRTDDIGQIYEQISVTNDDIQKLKKEQQRSDMITYEAIGDNRDTTTGIIRLIEPRQGVSVISDVDDTIKISEVLDKVRLLANTFIHPFKPVPGMAELYQKWSLSNKNCTFHYLSGMPDQLYTLTQEFILTNTFPDGSFHMRHFGWAASSLFNFLHSQSTFDHKISYLQFFFANTIRDYVLVGDSGEKDPEIYGEITREYPTRVRAIFIRAIKGESFDDARFLTAFQGVSQEQWQVFNDPQQLPIDLSRSPRPAAG